MLAKKANKRIVSIDRVHKHPATLPIFVMVGFISVVGLVCMRYKIALLEQDRYSYQVTYPLKRAKMGDVFDTKSFSFAVSNVEFDKTGTKEFPAPPHSQFVMISVAMHNKTTNEVSFIPALEVELSDLSGNVYELSPAPKIESESMAGAIAGLSAKSGTLGFIVPDTVEKLTFRYQPRPFPNAHTIVYDL